MLYELLVRKKKIAIMCSHLRKELKWKAQKDWKTSKNQNIKICSVSIKQLNGERQ